MNNEFPFSNHKSGQILLQGCILNVKFIFLPPPPFMIHICSLKEIYCNELVRAAGEKCNAFFCNFVNF